MWNCQYCGEKVDNIFTECWNCGTERNATHPKKHEEIQSPPPASEEEYARIFDRSYHQARELFKKEVPAFQIIEALEKNGLTLEDAHDIVEVFLAQMRIGKKQMKYGCVLGIGGIFATIVLVITGNDKQEVIALWTFWVGGLLFFKGLLKWSTMPTRE
jgi:hypothetical protein